jgi:exopolysaccharide biosynthesis polyprenyl glycosylphosphotransferase
MMFGNTAAALIAVLCLPAAIAITQINPVTSIELTIAVLALRLLTILIQTADLSHERGLVRLSSRQMWRDEATFALVFCATAFALDWQLSPRFAGIYLALNLAAQFAVHAAGHALQRLRSMHSSSTRDCRAIIIGTGARAKKVADALLDHLELDMAPCGFIDSDRKGLWRYRDIPLIGRLDDLEYLVLGGQVDAVFITTEPGEPSIAPQVLEMARKMGVTIHVVPGNTGVSSVLEVARLNGFPTIVYRATPYRYTAMALKRGGDFVGALILTILASPILLAAAIAVKLDSRGPVLFKQIRSGRAGRRFMIYKFRTMTCDAEKKKASLWNRNEMSGPVFKMRNDPRITRIGKFLRKYSIDELPQLFNVIAGDMSLVGPRPPLPSEVTGYEPWQRRKLSVRPGLTCLWQVNGRNAIDFNDWMRLDLEYIDSWSPALDMKILARTIPTVLKGSGV